MGAELNQKIPHINTITLVKCLYVAFFVVE